MSAIVPFARYAFPGARRAAAKALIRTGKITPRQYMAAYKIGRAAYRWRGIFKSKGYQRSKRRFVRNVRNVVRNVRSAQLKTTHLDFASDEQFTNKLNHLHHVQPYKLVYLGDGDNKRQSSTITCSGLRVQFCFANTQPNGGQPQSHLRTDYDIRMVVLQEKPQPSYVQDDVKKQFFSGRGMAIDYGTIADDFTEAYPKRGIDFQNLSGPMCQKPTYPINKRRWQVLGNKLIFLRRRWDGDYDRQAAGAWWVPLKGKKLTYTVTDTGVEYTTPKIYFMYYIIPHKDITYNLTHATTPVKVDIKTIAYFKETN
uniref:Putative capsid protein n=1 Tax=Farfantepenaeus duorarum pink shrimp associated circular virus TaxID=1692248 RepID=A0A0K1RL43_9CIRC|nr:putative capsid protein [Farfantepenaeus duorarum pink shrimp associated circular virus]